MKNMTENTVMSKLNVFSKSNQTIGNVLDDAPYEPYTAGGAATAVLGACVGATVGLGVTVAFVELVLFRVEVMVTVVFVLLVTLLKLPEPLNN